MQESCEAEGFFSNKDVFLTMTIFLSIKAIFRLRSVCKSFNQWLSDPLNFAWRRKIELAFPNSFKMILEENHTKQLRRLSVFDSLVESGHSVSYFRSVIPPDFDMATSAIQKVQLPWLKHLILICNEDVVILFNTNTASVVQRLEIPLWISDLASPGVLNVIDRKVAFMTDDGTIKLYRFEDDQLVHELDVTHDNFTYYDTFDQMYGNHVVLIDDSGDDIKLMFHSLLSNSVDEEIIVIPRKKCCSWHHMLSLMSPVIYLCYGDAHNYFICEVNCLTRQMTHLYASLYHITSPYDNTLLNYDYEMKSAKLVESSRGKYLTLYQVNLGSKHHIEIFDLTEKRVIYQSNVERNYSQLSQHRFFLASPWGRYFCVAGDNIFSLFDTEKTGPSVSIQIGPNANNTAEHSKDYHHGIVSQATWLNEDLVVYCISGAQRQVIFYSIKKRKEVATMNLDFCQIFVDGNTVIGLTTNNDMMKIELDMSYLRNNNDGHNGNNAKKRKLADCNYETNSEQQEKKRKILVKQNKPN